MLKDIGTQTVHEETPVINSSSLALTELAQVKTRQDRMEDVVKELQEQLKTLNLSKLPSESELTTPGINTHIFGPRTSKTRHFVPKQVFSDRKKTAFSISLQAAKYNTKIDTVGARQTTHKKLNYTTPLPEQPDYSTEIDIVGARQTTYKKLNDITPLPEQPNCSTEIDIVGARQTTYKKLNDITPLPEQPNYSTEIDIVGARQTTYKKLNDITPLPEQPNCSTEIDIVGARQTTQKKLNCTLHLTQIQYPPSTAKIRPNDHTPLLCKSPPPTQKLILQTLLKIVF
ncbi:hypothetical protein J6590_036505 [Homalodisca vitripennis]|nr:hypothetical protein J6590_036505 [Homalodisca vitripennis]